MTAQASPDLNRIQVFLKVVEEGGFTAAGRALSLPKSSVSRAVALLESELRARLLRRTSRKVVLTEAGSQFYERAARGIALLSEAREAVADLEVELRGPVRVTTAVDLGAWYVAPVAAAFSQRHPQVWVDVVLTSRVVDLQEEGFDFAVRAGGVRDENLVARQLPISEFGLYASSAYLARAGQPRRVSELAQHRCVLFRSPRGQLTWKLRGPQGEESVEVSAAVNADDFTFALQAVVAGAGIGLLPTFAANAQPPGALRRVLPRHAMPSAPVHLVYPAARYVPQRVAAFRDFFLAQVSASPPA
jgi:DNA-binding transcriptional LysR family regulator